MSKPQVAQLSPEGRLAVITARTIMFHEGSPFEAGITALQFGASKFEARFIELAYYWGNDLMDLCLAELSIEIPEHLQPSHIDLLEKKNAWVRKELERFPSYVSAEGQSNG